MKFVEITLEFDTNLSFIFEQSMLEILNLILVTHSCSYLVFLLKGFSVTEMLKKIQVMADTTGIWYNLFVSGEIEAEKSTKDNTIGLGQK